MSNVISKNKSNVIDFTRHRGVAGKFLPTRQAQRNALLKGQSKYALAIKCSGKWLVARISRAGLKILTLLALVILRFLHRLLRIAGRLCRLASIILPLIGLYLYFNPYAKMTPLLWQKGVMWEVLAISGAALWADLLLRI